MKNVEIFIKIFNYYKYMLHIISLYIFSEYIIYCV